MDIAERLKGMTRDLGTLSLGELVRFGADAAQRHASGFTVYRDGERLAEVLVKPGGDQEQVDRFASILYHLLAGSESRVADVEERLANLRSVLERKDREIAALRKQLSDFERSRVVRGPLYAVEVHSGVWLVGRPAADAFGLRYDSWHELATEVPGLRPCGVVQTDAIYVVMRPVGDLAREAGAP